MTLFDDYDEFARLHRTFYPPYQTLLTDGEFEELAYDPMSSVASLKDAAHSTPNTLYSYDSLGRLSLVRQLDDAATSDFIETDNAYGPAGNLFTFSDSHEGRGFLLSENGSGINSIVSYDDLGRLTSRVSTNGQVDQWAGPNSRILRVRWNRQPALAPCGDFGAKVD